MRATRIGVGIALVAGAIGAACASIIGAHDLGFGDDLDASAASDVSPARDVAGGDARGDGAALSCGDGTKACGGQCVVANTSYGCSTAGQCGPCAGKVNGLTSCADGGGCAVACSPGRADCDSDASDCEVDTTADIAHCGRCGGACDASAPKCSQGACVVSCPGGTTDCDGSCVDVQTSPTHCGTCARNCPSGGASTAVCTGGGCGLACNTGYADCDRDAANGCEANLAQDPLHCGTCPNACPPTPPPGAQAVLCVNGSCSLQCNGGYVDCDRDASDGCECAASCPGKCCVALGDQGCSSRGVPCCEAVSCSSDTCCLPAGALCSGYPTLCCSSDCDIGGSGRCL
jgi:hypothetical protein